MAQFSRPRSLFWPYSNHQEHPVFGADRHATAFTVSAPHRCLATRAEPLLRVQGWDPQRQLSTSSDGTSKLRVPDGLLHLTPSAGDV